MAIVKFDVLRKVLFGAITGSYTNFGTAMTQNLRMFKITNNTDGDMLISDDGTNDKMFVPAGGFILYDCAINAMNVKNSDSFFIGIGVQFSIKYSSAPTKGAVYFEGLYATGV